MFTEQTIPLQGMMWVGNASTTEVILNDFDAGPTRGLSLAGQMAVVRKRTPD